MDAHGRLSPAERGRDDLALVRAVLDGDVAARDAFVARMDCAVRILNARNRRAGSPLSVDELLDVVQEVQLTVWRRLADFEGRAPLESWVLRISHLVLLRFLEQRRRQRALRRLCSEDVLTPARPAGEEESMATLLRRLTPREAQVTRLRFVEALELEEIARVLELSPSSVKTLLYRSLEKLRALAPAPEVSE